MNNDEIQKRLDETQKQLDETQKQLEQQKQSKGDFSPFTRSAEIYLNYLRSIPIQILLLASSIIFFKEAKQAWSMDNFLNWLWFIMALIAFLLSLAANATVLFSDLNSLLSKEKANILNKYRRSTIIVGIMVISLLLQVLIAIVAIQALRMAGLKV